MSDARQQAIDAIVQAILNNRGGGAQQIAIDALDAIPGDVHAQLAINKGALYEAGWGEPWPLLYRLAGKDPQ